MHVAIESTGWPPRWAGLVDLLGSANGVFVQTMAER
jgi:hypothetical protein